MNHGRITVLGALVLLGFGCGDDDSSSNPNNIVIAPDTGMVLDMGTDEGTSTDASSFDADPEVVYFLRISPLDLDLKVGAQLKASATVLADGVEIEAGATTWRTTDPDVATVDDQGFVSGVSPGSTRVEATIGEFQGQAVVNVSSVHTQVATGRAHTCTRKVDGRVTCFGDNSLSQMAGLMGSQTPLAVEVRMPANATATSVLAGSDHTCALLDTGNAVCWGNNDRNQIGPETMNATASTPSPVSFALPATKLALGDGFSCALLNDGSLRCWGDNTSGQISAADIDTITSPTNPQPGMTFRDIAAGDDHICGITNAFDMMCWGSNSGGQLTAAGAGGGHDAVRAGTTSYTLVAAGGAQTCGFSLFQGLQCWGTSGGGFNDLAVTSTDTPVTIQFPDVPDAAVQDLTVGADHLCALFGDVTYCWGKNDRGQVGDGTNDDRALPTSLVVGFTDVSAGLGHTCGVADGDVFCWGGNMSGQLGDSTNEQKRQPTFAPPQAF